MSYSLAQQVKGVSRAVVDVVRDMCAWRYLVYQIAKQSIIEKCAQSYFDLFWVFAAPFLYTFVFVFLKNNRIFAGQDTILPYPLHAFYGMIIWQMFSGIILVSNDILMGKYRRVLTVNFPKESLVYGNSLPILLNTFILLVFFIPLSFIYGVAPGREIFLLPVLLFFVALFAYGVAKILVIIGVFTRDIRWILQLVIFYWMLATPAIYSSGVTSRVLEYINPVNSFIEVARLLLFNGLSGAPGIFYFHCGLSVLIFIAGTYFFRKNISAALERL